MSQWPARDEQLKSGLRNISINGECSGRDSDATVIAIRHLQKSVGLNPDGRVSRANRATYVRKGQKHSYLVFYLNATLREMYPDLYPRIDKMPEFVWRIREQATRPFLG